MHASPASLVSTGVPGLDAILRGGLPIKRIYLLQGAPGVGKTTLGLQFLLEGLRHGEGGLYVTLSETEDELRAVAISHGWNLAGITLHQLSTPEELLEQQRASTIFHTAEVELNETVSKVMNLVERTKPARIVIDSLSEGHETTIRQFDVGREGIRFGPPLSEFRGVLTGVPEYVGPEAGLSSGQR